ncbi:uncharacterized protein B0T23DRAFT_157976 [Neurospora hispaniola]|uniref:Uncharacterized protein n=1 Tax=Neurospora hispaniola TaxID=588809 RepID=A0AAJ0MQ38_9PEZI|nr:hypothetical protein B0T23DRAFT_157976 [Neurospora hispaniola]
MVTCVWEPRSVIVPAFFSLQAMSDLYLVPSADAPDTRTVILIALLRIPTLQPMRLWGISFFLFFFFFLSAMSGLPLHVGKKHGMIDRGGYQYFQISRIRRLFQPSWLSLYFISCSFPRPSALLTFPLSVFLFFFFFFEIIP